MTAADEQERRYAEVTGRWWDQDTHPEIAQAVGMIAEQLDASCADVAGSSGYGVQVRA